MPVIILSALQILLGLIFVTTLIDIAIIIIAEIRKQAQIGQFAEGHMSVSGGAGILSQAIWLQSL